MKFKKLLPIAAVASTAAVVAPLVTSCGVANITWSTEFVDGEIKNPYKTQIAPHAKDETGMNDEDASKAYFEDVSKNPKIFADDWMATLYTSITGQLPNSDMVEGDGDPDTGSGSINLSLSKIQDRKISGKIKIKLNAKGSPRINEPTGDIKADTIISFHNVPVAFGWTDPETHWWVSADEPKLDELDWQIKISVNAEFEMSAEGSSVRVFSIIDQTYNKANKEVDDWAQYFNFASFYFYEVAHI